MKNIAMGVERERERLEKRGGKRARRKRHRECTEGRIERDFLRKPRGFQAHYLPRSSLCDSEGRNRLVGRRAASHTTH